MANQGKYSYTPVSCMLLVYYPRLNHLWMKNPYEKKMLMVFLLLSQHLLNFQKKHQTGSIRHCKIKSQLLLTNFHPIVTFLFEESSFLLGIYYIHSIFDTNCSILFLSLLNGSFYSPSLKVFLHAHQHLDRNYYYHH